MKGLRLDRWASQIQPPRNPRLHVQQQRCLFSHSARPIPRHHLHQRQCQTPPQWRTQRRSAASRRGVAGAAAAQAEDAHVQPPPITPGIGAYEARSQRNAFAATSSIPLNSPSPTRARQSAKLSALHARLSLPARLPLETLARCLIDPSVDSRPGFNNASLAVLGQDLLGLYTTEYLMCHYPRLPMPVLFAAQYAYVGPATLAAMRAEWGVEVVAAPGPEVDPGLLQLQRIIPGNALAEDGVRRVKDVPRDPIASGSGRPDEQWHHRRGTSSRIVYDDQFGDLQVGLPPFQRAAQLPGGPAVTLADEKAEDAATTTPTTSGSFSSLARADGTTVEDASATFVRALAGALYLHAGADAPKAFHRAHVLSRQLPLHTLFHFTHPTRDLSRLCDREGFEPPVARLLSETGRVSRSPVFVVGVFSGDDKLGEGAGSSLNEARVRAAAAALRAWYLYSPPDTEVMLPSDAEATGAGAAAKKAWKPQLVDVGEVIT